MGHSTFDKRVELLATEGFHVTEILLAKVLEGVNEAVPSEATHKLYAAMLMAAAPLKFMATMIAKGIGADEKLTNTGKETMLVAALIAARITFPSKNPNGDSSDGINVDFTPRNVLAAIEAAKLIGGADVCKFLDHRMVEEYQDGAERSNTLTLGYWDYLDDDNSPSFDTLSDELSAFMQTNKTRH